MPDINEDKESLKKLRARAGQCKASFTRFEGYVETPRANLTPAKIHTIKTRLKTLEDVLNTYQQLQIEISLLCDKIKDEKFIEEDLEDRYYELYEWVSSLSTVETESKGMTGKPNNKLPNIDIGSFTGEDITKYVPFIQLFTAVVGNDASLAPVQKLYYLRSHLKKEALALIEGLPLADTSYEEALRLLKDRYDNPCVLITSYVNAILDYPAMQKGTAASIHEFVSSMKQQIGALKNMKQPVESWDMLLLPILLRKIDQYSSRAYHMDRDKTKLPSIADFMDFLERRAASFEESQRLEMKQPVKKMVKPVNLMAVNKNEVKTESPACRYCDLSNHKLFNCPKFKMLEIKERINFIKDKVLCEICLNPHKNKCKFRFKCLQCNSKEHNSLLHFDEVSVNTTCVPSQSQGVVLLPTVKVKVAKADGSYVIARGLLDSGSQTSFITKELKNELNIQSFTKKLNVTTLGQLSNPVSEAIVVNITSNVHNSFTQSVVCSVVDKITSPLPQFKLNMSGFVPNVIMADDQYNVPGEISLLLAADIFFNVLIPENIRLKDGLILQNTKFGFIIAGGSSNLHHNTTIRETASNFISSVDKDKNLDQSLAPIMEKFFEVESLGSEGSKITEEEELCEKDFQEKVQLKDGKFQVSLPLKVPLASLNLGDSFSVAIQRLNYLYKRFSQNETLHAEYAKFINEYVSLGHAKIFDINNTWTAFNSMYFLSHHAVIREDKRTTKLRVVFDGSAKTKSKISINDVLYNGKIPQKDLFDILTTFRSYEYVFLTDIKSMFRQIEIDPSQRHLQNILWKNDANAPVKCLQLQTVTYGLKSSSFLATRCLHELAERFQDELPLAADVLRYNTYIDDILAGSSQLDRSIEVRDQTIKLLKKGGFELHKWSANNPALLRDIPPEKQHFQDKEMNSKETAYLKALGISYNVQTDQFKIGVSQPDINDISWSKRQVLKYIGRIFDPLGLIAPIILRAKLFMQALWQLKLNWDDTLSDELHKKWCEFYESLCDMSTIFVNRNVLITNATDVCIVGFCDASQAAYGCCLYARVTHGETVHVNLLCAKSRVAPQKNKLTIPKLELCSALLLSELASRVTTILKINKVSLFTDSMVALAWIQSQKINKLEPFVKNRVNKIKKLTSVADWHHVSGVENPADCLSRGVEPQSLASNTLWWHGPDFLLNSNFSAKNLDIDAVDNEEYLEPETAVVGCHAQESILPILENCSNISKMQYVIAYVFRFYNNCRTQVKSNSQPRITVSNASSKPITAVELNFALVKIINCVQSIYFQKELHCLQNNLPIKSHMLSLSPFIDGNGSLRVGGRIKNANVPYEQKHPLLLPKSCHVTNLIIQREHLNLLHAGPKLTLFSLSQKYWLISGIREVKKNIHKCIQCFRLKADAAAQMMGSLPASRLQVGSPFQTVGIDYCGPFDLKQSRIRKPLITKGYVALFVCFLTKAIHMELVSDMSTETFLAALKRFISRRGLPDQIYCDNATTFKGACNQLKDLHDLNQNDDHISRVSNYCAQQGVKFNFIPSYSPTFGGLWEAGVKSAKHHFKRVMSKSVFSYEEFQTIITQVEGVLNSRPLTPVTQDPCDFTCLTPGHFLIGRTIMSLPERDYTQINENRLKFWKQCIQKVQHFWKVWQNCYLTQLQNRPKWKLPVKNLEKGQLVLIKEQTSPLWWPLARITNVFPGKDNKVRVVELVLPNKKIKRIAANKVCLLPIYED